MIVKAECLFCDANIEGERNNMVGGTGIGRDGRRRPKWLKESPEFNWDWNGIEDIIFYLCPLHTDTKHYREALRLAQKFQIYK